MADLVMQRGMLAQLAARLRARQGVGEGGGEDDEGAIVVDDNCSVSGSVLCRGSRSTNWPADNVTDETRLRRFEHQDDMRKWMQYDRTG